MILAATAVTYAPAPLLTKMLQEMRKTFTDIYSMTAKEIRWLIERASGNAAAETSATTSSAMAAPAAPDPDDNKNRNWNKVKEKYWEKKLKEELGQRRGIKKYDIKQEKIWLKLKHMLH